jgi:hypothetical protein
MKNKINFTLDGVANALGEKSIVVKFNYGYQLNGKYIPLNFTTGYSTHPLTWDATDKRIITLSKKLEVRFNNNRKDIINEGLNQLELDIFYVIDQFKNDKVKPTLPSPDQIKTELKRIREKIEPKQDQVTFTPIIDFAQSKIVDSCKGNGKSVYQTALNILSEYHQEVLKGKKDFVFETLTIDDVEQYFNWLYTTKSMKGTKYASQTINGYQRFVRHAIKTAIDYDIPCKVKPSLLKIQDIDDNQNIALTKERLNELINLKKKLGVATVYVKNGTRGEGEVDPYEVNLDELKDWLIISSLTAYRFSDWTSEPIFKTINGKKYLVKGQQKTGKVVTAPVYKPVLDIYKKYGNKFPPIPRKTQLVNEGYREIGQLMEWDELVEVNNPDPSSKKRFMKVKFYSKMTTHLGRRSYCSMMYHEGLRPHDIMKVSGHADLETFLKYINIPDDVQQQSYDERVLGTIGKVIELV